ncbi:hypothetical protein HYT23_04450 [Candidatus Pacearchaeota archaeon]|nr:hypothetical protein [Candidatus Pacearchaeota archaeon]
MTKSLDVKVKVNGKESYLIEFPVGDWSDDGHGRCDYYHVLSNKPINKVREAHFKAEETLGIDIGSICSNNEDSHLNPALAEKLKELGYCISKIGFPGVWDDSIILDSGDIFNIWTFLLSKIDPSLKLKRLDAPSISFYGKDKKGRYINTPGYGCFCVK